MEQEKCVREAVAMNVIRPLSNVPHIVFAGMMFVSALHAQASRQLQIEVGPNQQVAIVASDVSYGEVLRVIGQKLGWEIDIPAVADQLKISRMRVEATKPGDALRKLLEGSQLGYAFQDAGNGSLKVAVIPLDKDKPVPSSATAQTQSSTPAQPNETVAVATPNRPDAPVTMSFSEATKAAGAPPGVPSSDVGRKVTFTMSEAAKIMGVPPGVSPSDVGKIVTLPLSTGASKRP
jgi:hypothetical protein